MFLSYQYCPWSFLEVTCRDQSQNWKLIKSSWIPLTLNTISNGFEAKLWFHELKVHWGWRMENFFGVTTKEIYVLGVLKMGISLRRWDLYYLPLVRSLQSLFLVDTWNPLSQRNQLPNHMDLDKQFGLQRAVWDHQRVHRSRVLVGEGKQA